MSIETGSAAGEVATTSLNNDEAAVATEIATRSLAEIFDAAGFIGVAPPRLVPSLARGSRPGRSASPVRTERACHCFVRSAHDGETEVGILSPGVRAQLQLSSVRRISVGSTVFGFTSCLRSGKYSRIWASF